MPSSTQIAQCAAVVRARFFELRLRKGLQAILIVSCAAIALAASGFLRGRAQPAPAIAARAPSAVPGPQPAPAVYAQDEARKQQIADLLKLAIQLKADVDKSTKDELSVSVVREAGQIEQLVHKLKSETPRD